MTEKEKKRKDRQDKIDKELNEALKRKNALERERKRIQKILSDKEQKKNSMPTQVPVEPEDPELAKANEIIRNTLIIPPDNNLPNHLYTEQEIEAKKALELAKRLTKKDFNGDVVQLTQAEILKRIKNMMESDGFDDTTFYQTHPEWFAFETRLRDMMLAILEPLVRKGLFETTHVAKVIEAQATQKRKVDEFEFQIQKMVKAATTQDEFAKMIESWEMRIRKKEDDLDAKIKEIHQIQIYCDQQYQGMIKERRNISQIMQNQDESIQKYFDELSIFKLQMESVITTARIKIENLVDATLSKQDKIYQRLEEVNQLNEIIREQFKHFGSETEELKKIVQEIDNKCKYLERTKAPKDKTIERLDFFQKMSERNDQNLEQIRLDLQQTDRYIHVFQPITQLNKMSQLFQAVFRRRRHQAPLDRYVQQEQFELLEGIKTKELKDFDKKFYQKSDPIKIDRKQSIDSEYIRENVRMFKQIQQSKASGSQQKRTSLVKNQSSAQILLKTQKVLQSEVDDISLADSKLNQTSTAGKKKKLQRNQTQQSLKILSLSSNNILQQIKISQNKQISGENSPLPSDLAFDTPDKNLEKKNDSPSKQKNIIESLKKTKMVEDFKSSLKLQRNASEESNGEQMKNNKILNEYKKALSPIETTQIIERDSENAQSSVSEGLTPKTPYGEISPEKSNIQHNQRLPILLNNNQENKKISDSFYTDASMMDNTINPSPSPLKQHILLDQVIKRLETLETKVIQIQLNLKVLKEEQNQKSLQNDLNFKNLKEQQNIVVQEQQYLKQLSLNSEPKIDNNQIASQTQKFKSEVIKKTDFKKSTESSVESKNEKDNIQETQIFVNNFQQIQSSPIIQQATQQYQQIKPEANLLKTEKIPYPVKVDQEYSFRNITQQTQNNQEKDVTQEGNLNNEVKAVKESIDSSKDGLNILNIQLRQKSSISQTSKQSSNTPNTQNLKENSFERADTNFFQTAEMINKDQKIKQMSTDGDDAIGEDDQSDESIKFVTFHELKAVKKEFEEVHTANDALRSFITEVQSDLIAFSTRVSNKFSWDLYSQDWDDQKKENIYLKQLMYQEIHRVSEWLDKVEKTELNDRKILHVENVSLNRRLYDMKVELKTDLTSFSKIIREQDQKLDKFLGGTLALTSLAALLQEILTIQTQLMKQDEIDKKNIFLMGLRQEDQIRPTSSSQCLSPTRAIIRNRISQRLHDHYGEPPQLNLGDQHKRNNRLENEMNCFGQPPKDIINFNHHCFGCSDQPQRIISAFKMACLSYKPSKVMYLGQQLSRDAMLVLTEQLIREVYSLKSFTDRTVIDLKKSLNDNFQIVNSTEASIFAGNQEEQFQTGDKLAPQLNNFEAYGELTSVSRSPICVNSVSETEYLENNKSQKQLENTIIKNKIQPPLLVKLNERQNVLNYSSDLNEADQKIVKSLDNNHIFEIYEPICSQEVIQFYAKNSLQQDNTMQGLQTNEGLKFEDRHLKVDVISHKKMEMEKKFPESINILGQQGTEPQSSSTDPDRFNNTFRNMINIEVRDWADRQYLDLKTRDVNGNVKQPIGEKIDDIQGRVLYSNDNKHQSQLEKLSMINRKNKNLLRANISDKPDANQFILPQISTPFTQNDSSDTLFLANFKSYKDNVDKDIDRLLMLARAKKIVEERGFSANKRYKQRAVSVSHFNQKSEQSQSQVDESNELFSSKVKIVLKNLQ